MAKKASIKPRTTRAIISNGIIEIYEYEKPIFLGCEHAEGRPTKQEMDERLQGMTPEQRDEYEQRRERRRKSTCTKNRNMVRRLAITNFGNHSKFITLTFKENKQDVQECNKLFRKFVRKIKDNVIKDLKYISVIEFQERGAIHYHMICNMPYTKHKILETWWHSVVGKDQGTVCIEDISQVDNVGAYIIKYMTKDTDDPRLRGNLAYLSSRNLDRPKVLYGKEAEIVAEAVSGQKKEVFANSYISEYQGNVTYKEYNLNRV